MTEFKTVSLPLDTKFQFSEILEIFNGTDTDMVTVGWGKTLIVHSYTVNKNDMYIEMSYDANCCAFMINSITDYPAYKYIDNGITLKINKGQISCVAYSIDIAKVDDKYLKIVYYK